MPDRPGAAVATPSRRRFEDSLRLIELSIVDCRNRIKKGGGGEAGLYDSNAAASVIRDSLAIFGASLIEA